MDTTLCTLRGRPRDLALAGLIALATLVVYLPVLDFGFVTYDDPEYVAANPFVLGGFSESGWVFAFSDTEHANWHPLTWLSHMFDVELFGENPAGHHAINALLHALNSALLFWFLRFATGAVFRSAFVAALFALHPLHIESVAWVSERKDVLSTAFGLLAAITYTSYARRGGALRYAIVTLAFGAALLSKSMLVTLPCLFLLWDDWPLRRIEAAQRDRRKLLDLLIEKLPWFAMSLALCIVTLDRQTGAGTMDWSRDLGVGARVAASIHAYAGYIAALAWPADLAVHYAHPYLAQMGGTPPPIALVALEAAVLGLITASVFRRRCPGYARTGWLWFLGTLVPVIGLVQVGSQGMADRYTYLPSVGLFVVVVWIAAEGFERLGRRSGRPRRALAVASAALVLASCAFATVRHLPTWGNSESLIRGALALNPRNTTMWLALGDARRAQGDSAGAQQAYASALEIHPGDTTAHSNLARLLFEAGERDRAIRHYRAALAEASRPAEAHSNLGSALVEVGQLAEGIAELRRAVAIDAHFAEGHYNLGNALFTAGQLAEAAEAYAAAIRERPDFAAAHLNLGRVTGARGDPRGALRHFRRALELAPDYPAARQSLERALAMVDAKSP